MAIDSAADMDILFGGIPIGDVTTSMTISGPAVPIFCMYLVAAERQGVDPGALNGTLQTDIFKEYIAQKEWLFPPEPHLRLIGDLMEYCAEKVPAYKPLSVSGYHIREAGSTAAQELAFTLADGFGYVELGLSRGLDIDVFAPGLVVLLRRAHRLLRGDREVPGGAPDLGPLAARRLRRARPTRRSGCVSTPRPRASRSPRSSRTTTSSAPRSRRWQRCSAGPTRLHTNALDEVLALPSERAAQIALRTQQVIAEETGVANVADPLGGSWYVEALTDDLEAEAERIFEQIRGFGDGTADNGMTSGILRGIETGWFTSEIAEAAFQYQTAVEKGDKKIVGVNCFPSADDHPLEILRVSSDIERDQRAELAARRQARDEAAVRASLVTLREAAQGSANLVPPMLDAARAEATLGEICGVLRDLWGGYVEPPTF